ncbi:MAG: DEAD/DEAH box helicase [Dokdonella sp.]
MTLQLSTAQQSAYQALRAFATGEQGAQMMTLEGYAGTGKTTLVGELVRALAPTIDIAIAAPTNKAVGVLHEKIGDVAGVEFRSIHSFLGLRMTEREDGTRECRPDGTPSLHQYQIVIIDECSMIGADLFRMIVMSAMSCRVLFVGDPAQLPPVERSGLQPVVSPTFERVQHKAILTEVVRQAADNPIIGLSMRIRDAIEQGVAMSLDTIAFAVNGAGDRTWVAPGGEAAIYNLALGAIKNGVDARIVAYRNLVVDRYNRMLHVAIHGPETPFNVGETVIINEHFDDARRLDAEWARARRVTLYTSEEATVAALVPEAHPHHPNVPAYRVTLDRDEEPSVSVYIPADMAAFNSRKDELWKAWRELKQEEELARMNSQPVAELAERRKDAARAAGMFTRAFAPLRHVYAITAHKSQGSTLDTVIVDFGDLSRMRDPFDFNRALYVAVTRAANNVAIIA